MYPLLYIVLVLQLLVRVMLVPKVDAKSGEAALVVFQVAFWPCLLAAQIPMFVPGDLLHFL